MSHPLLSRKLHTLTSDEIRKLRKIADEVFEPLTRPFRQKRSEPTFDFGKTVRTASRYGDFIPQYRNRIREHRKSRLVIAMSLSGIDRCAAVSLIPLFGELRKFLDFKLFIYTDDIVPAVFTQDGFLENDIDIAWNNVAAPVVFSRLASMQFDRKEDTLLLIDNLGGGDSKWCSYWTNDLRREVRSEQARYLETEGRKGYWVKIRQELGGDYDQIKTNSYANRLKAWQEVVERNTQERWVEAPAMFDYLVRWLFHPQFGRKTHSDLVVSRYGESSHDSLRKLKGKFRSVHLLRTIPHDESTGTLESILTANVVDFLHEAETIEQFANVLGNIVHNRSTERVSHETIKFGEVTVKSDSDDSTEPDEDHVEMILGKEECFRRVPFPEKTIPEEEGIVFSRHIRGKDEIREELVPWRKLDISHFFPTNLNQYGGLICSLTPSFHLNDSMSKFSRIQEAEKVLEFIRKKKIVTASSGSMYVANRSVVLQESPGYDAFRTRQLKPFVDDYLSLWSEDYHTFTDKLPLANVIWCTGGVYDHRRLAYAVAYESPQRWKTTVFHEHGHHMEHICPQIGVFTNSLLKAKTGGWDESKKVDVYGGTAMPAVTGSPWIVPYAGKWYNQAATGLPVSTEIISVHSEYFTDPESLLRLMSHDPFMVKFMAFVFMGGPIQATQSMKEQRLQEAISSREQHNMKKRGYVPSPGRRGGGGRRSSGGREKKDTSKSFGV